MGLRRLREFSREAVVELEEQASRLRFTPGLLDSLATTMLRSIQAGDGKIWSNSFLVTSLINDTCSIRTLLDHFPAHRTRLISEKEFLSTLATSDLTIDTTFQTTLQHELEARARKGMGTICGRSSSH